MKQHGVILLLLSIFLCGPGCKEAQQEQGSPQEKGPVPEQTQKKSVGMKEIKIRPQITDNDLGFKLRNIRRFLDNGNKTKITMYFRGREIVRE